MQSTMKTVIQFQQYAEKSLNQHLTQLSVQYHNRSFEKETKLQAFKDHRQIFNNELSQKIESLLKNEEHSPWLMAELEELKRTFMEKLSMERLYE